MDRTEQSPTFFERPSVEEYKKNEIYVGLDSKSKIGLVNTASPSRLQETHKMVRQLELVLDYDDTIVAMIL